MANVRVMFVGHGPSNLPEDRVINVFHFVGSGAYAATAELALDNVEDFYLETFTQTLGIASWLSPWIQRSAELRAYDLTAAKPRIPTIRAITLPSIGAADGAPEEVAVCLSYLGAPPITRRRRGRIFVGPLKSSAVVAATSSVPARPHTSLMSDLTIAATRLATFGVTCQWSIRSSLPAENFVPIVSGYVDNALDTQRRRGPVTTARTLWTTVGL
jgi:hypothetical protein